MFFGPFASLVGLWVCELWMCGFVGCVSYGCVDLWIYGMCELWMYCGYNLGEFIGVLCLYFRWLQSRIYFNKCGLIKIII